VITFAKNGSEVLQVDGLSTASLVNPVREGQLWAESQTHAMNQLQSQREDEPVIVLGVASGFHLQALKTQLRRANYRGRISAIDSCESSIAFSKLRVTEIEYLHVNSALGVDAFLSRPDVSSWCLQPFTILRHKPTYLRNGADLRKIESWILGRTPEAFSAQLKLRPQIAAALNPARARKIADVSLVSIRDLSKTWDISGELKTDRRVFRILEELVR
jgi:hypothetical protein